MKFSSSSIINKDDHNEQLKNQQDKFLFNHFLFFNEKKLISLENCHCSLNDSLIEEDKDNRNKTFSYECNQCLKIYASEYGYNYHINMYHSNQSILCSDCNITFRSHRALKTHQQRFHLNYSQNLPNYNYISSYLIVAFSTKQFSLITKNACEQGRLPLGELSSKLYPCDICHISFSCSNALKYHLLNKHEQYEYKICKNILYDIVIQVEYDLKTVDNDDDDDIESMKYLLSKQASNFGLVDKQLAREIRCIKHEHNHLIYPKCQHQNRTCANLCLEYLSSYNKLIDNYSYKITTIPKTNPFIHGSIVSKPLNRSLINTSITTKDESNSNQKRTSLKRVKSSISDFSLSPQTKRKFKVNEIKSSPIVQSSTSPKKISHSYTRSLSSMSSNSVTSTRTSSKTSRHQTITSLKRSLSPEITLAVERSSEKRRRQREQRKAKAVLSSSSSSDIVLKIDDDDIEQENDDDDDTNDTISIKCKKPKKTRQASNSSVEYVQILNNDQQSIASLNNIENIKLKSNDKDIILCQSPPTVKKIISSSDKNLSKTSVNNQHVPDYDEHIRVRCKICDDILEGRSRFSKHVLTMHSHLLKNKMPDIKQQQTTIVR
ncbi:unnamed protein product [Adineta steineri]|uniref:C2H2-type domain-containing protein n=2 Tax=Adineta steineri TaxID=433720 RepID=A0A819HTK0_9BILA|nr:unnamed protein product [Adineta steineri]